MRLSVVALEMPVDARLVDLAAASRRHYGLGPIASLDRRDHRNALRIERALLGHPDELFLLAVLRKRAGRRPTSGGGR